MAWKILCIAGARPNFMKIAPLLRAFGADARFDARLVHTGQHYDEKLSKIFFEDLAIPRPHVELEVGSGSHAQQTAEIMRRFEGVVETEQPDGVLVVGDVNSTVGCALVASKYVLKNGRRPIVIHVEAGLRSRDHDMPEEINRLVTDVLSDLLYVSEPDGMTNLAREGAGDRAVLVGNVMIDTLLAARDRAMQSRVLDELGLAEGAYGLVTLHRPSNVDDPGALRALLGVLSELDLPLVFPVHPRTRKRIADAGIALANRWRLIDPLGYLDFMRLTSAARVVLTDSGGVQEEAPALGKPVLVLRDVTERPEGVEAGTCRLVGPHRDRLLPALEELLADPAAYRRMATARNPYGDGRAAERVADLLQASAPPAL